MDTDNYRILGVDADATEEQIRQAYLDLVRVWHPDRFESDPRLRRIAEEHIRQINDAYAALSNRGRTSTRSETAGAETLRTRSHHAGRQRTPRTERYWTTDSSRQMRPAVMSFGTLSRLASRFFQSGLTHALAGVIVCLIPYVVAARLLTLLYPPAMDLDLILRNAHALRPRILMPARIIDPASDIRLAADTLTEWVRGEVIDLWKPLNWNSQKSPITVARTVPAQAPSAREPRKRRREHTMENDLPVANGTELLDAGRLTGAGEILLVNNTDMEEIATLVRGRTPVRAVYIKPNSRTHLRSIGTGLYDLRVELGRDLEPRQLRFRNSRVTPAPVGPFEFFEIVAANGRSGQRYEVVMNAP